MNNYQNIYFYYSKYDNKLHIEARYVNLHAKIFILDKKSNDIICSTSLLLLNDTYWILPSINLYDIKEIKIEIKDEKDIIIREEFMNLNKELEDDNGNIKYLAGGLLGDFIHQLSVIKENYLKTGKRGDVYLLHISNIVPNGEPLWSWESWNYGVVKAYEDLKEIISYQDYISSFQIYKQENFENYIHLSNFYEIYKDTYNVEWGSHKWLELPVKENYENYIFISASKKRYNYYFDFNSLKKYNKEIFFITTNINEYNYFKENSKCDFDLILFDNLMDYWIAINSCFLFVSNLSSFLSVALSLQKNNIALLPDENLQDDIVHFPRNLINSMWYKNEKENNL